MLNKIKDKFINILRENCGYYELREECNILYSEQDFHIKKIKNLMNKFNQINIDYDVLSSKYEAKILEYDILDNKYKKIVNVYTNCSTLNNHYDTEEIIKVGERENSYLYKKYLVAELEEILKIMKEKGIHPQDLIKRIINKANRDLK